MLQRQYSMVNCRCATSLQLHGGMNLSTGVFSLFGLSPGDSFCRSPSFDVMMRPRQSQKSFITTTPFLPHVAGRLRRVPFRQKSMKAPIPRFMPLRSLRRLPLMLNTARLHGGVADRFPDNWMLLFHGNFQQPPIFDLHVICRFSGEKQKKCFCLCA